MSALRYYFFILLCCPILTAAAQKSIPDSLALAVQKEKNDSVKVILLAQLSKYYYSSDGQKAVSYGEEALRLARRSRNITGEAQALNNIGGAYFMLGNYPRAATYHFQALKIRERIYDSTGLCATYNNLGNIYNYQNDTLQALRFYRHALLISNNIRNQKAISMALNNIGNLYERINQTDKAISYYKQALKIKRAIADETGICISLNNLGDLNIDKKNYPKAKVYFEEALRRAGKMQDKVNRVYALRGLAHVYHQLSLQDSRALAYAQESLDLAYQLHSKEEIRESAAELQDVYKAIGDYKKAHYYLGIYQKYGDSLITETGQRELAQMQVQFESAKKDKENIKLKLDRALQAKELERKNNTQWLFTLISVALALVTGVSLWSRSRIKKTKEVLEESHQKIKAQHLALTEQAALLGRQKEELEKLNTLKNRLFSIVSHDLRSPLGSIQGFIQLLQEGVLSPEEFNGLLPLFDREISQTISLIDNLLMWAKSQMEGLKLVPRPVTLYDLVNENLFLLQPQATSKQIMLTNELDPALQALADGDTVNFVVRNLVSNAIKFTNPGGTVTVAARQNQDFLAISITDSGTGISPANLEKLFQKEYFTTRGTNKEKGTGLGLILCQEFIQLNGGALTVTSEIGQGSTFTFTLPVYSKTAAAVSI